MSEPVPPRGVRVVTPEGTRGCPVRFLRHEPDGMALWTVDVTADEASALVSGTGSLEVDLLPPRTSLTVDVSASAPSGQAVAARCGAPHPEGRGRTCDLPPEHEQAHRARRLGGFDRWGPDLRTE